MNGNNKKEEFYTPPPKMSGLEQFQTFLWNPETKQFLGRTAGSWIKIIFFYTCFYLVLASYWGGLWIAFKTSTITNEKPRYQLAESLIGTNPGLGFRPMPSEDHLDSTLIWYKRDGSGFVNWTTQLDDFLKYYREPSKMPGGGRNLVSCNYTTHPQSGEVCRVPLQQMYPCNGQFYSYDKGTPCIFLKLNKIYNWLPEYYNDSSNLPDKMPNHLKDYVKMQKGDELNTVWVTCEGENPADKENIGTIHFAPRRGFPSFYFPFMNNPGYLSPLVAVWFQEPKPGVLINIECKAWAKNIVYDRHERRGSVHFEIMID